MRIDKVAVLGAGVMGSGIAAHLANCGLDVVLLDRVPDGARGAERSSLAVRAIEALRKGRSGFYAPAIARRVEPGNVDDDAQRIAECDWVIEVVVEDLAVKHDLLARRVVPHLRDDAVLSSNTSGLSVRAIAARLPEEVRRRFLVTHFFNPPRLMRLVEVVPCDETAPEVLAGMSDLIRRRLGKAVVRAKDTPNFIANRIGVFSMCNGFRHLGELGLSIEEADAVAGPPTARPATGLFRLADLVGLDTILHVAENSYRNQPDDEARETFRATALVEALVRRRLLGDKVGAGFYKRQPGAAPLVWDPRREDHAPAAGAAPAWTSASRKLDAADRLRAMMAAKDDRTAEFAWRNLRDTLLYAFLRVPEIADDVVAVDEAMRSGFGWELGPFEMLDAIGVPAFVARAERDGLRVPAALRHVERFYRDADGGRRFLDLGARKYRPVPAPPERIELARLRGKGGAVEENAGASLLDLGDGVLALELHTKMNAIDGSVLEMLRRSVRIAEERGVALVLANEGRAFSVGADLAWVLAAAAEKEFDRLGGFVDEFQRACMALRYAKVPVVAAPHGLALGGGCELCLHSAAIVALAETTMGLVETGVGLVPAGGGTKELAVRAILSAAEVGTDPTPFLARAFDLVANARKGGSADELREMGFLRRGDDVVIDPDARIHQAKAKALALAGCYRPPLSPGELKAPGRDAAAALQANLYNLRLGGFIGEHDARVGAALARVLTGGDVPSGAPVSEAHFLGLEREAFLSLCGEPSTLARIRHTLETGKPLRN
ncbi:MAG TPA: FAD-dependent oxidoreductase [Anaeromyxobacter sp.]